MTCEHIVMSSHLFLFVRTGDRLMKIPFYIWISCTHLMCFLMSRGFILRWSSPVQKRHVFFFRYLLRALCVYVRACPHSCVSMNPVFFTASLPRTLSSYVRKAKKVEYIPQ